MVSVYLNDNWLCFIAPHTENEREKSNTGNYIVAKSPKTSGTVGILCLVPCPVQKVLLSRKNSNRPVLISGGTFYTWRTRSCFRSQACCSLGTKISERPSATIATLSLLVPEDAHQGRYKSNYPGRNLGGKERGGGGGLAYFRRGCISGALWYL